MTEGDPGPRPPGGAPALASRLATVGGFGAILLWSTTVALARRLSEDLGPITGAAAVYSVSGLISVALLLADWRNARQMLQLSARYLVGCGGLFVGYMLLLYLAIGYAGNRQQVLEVGLVNYLWPALTLLLSLALLGLRGTWVLLPGTVLALAGVFLVVTQGQPVTWASISANLASHPSVYLLALGAAGAWALYSNLTRRWAEGKPTGAVALFLPVTAIILLAMASGVDEPRRWTQRAIGETLFLGVATSIAFALWDTAMRRGNVVAVAAASYLTPLFSTLVSCAYLAVLPGWSLWVGCALLIVGSLLSWQGVWRPTDGEQESATTAAINPPAG